MERRSLGVLLGSCSLDVVESIGTLIVLISCWKVVGIKALSTFGATLGGMTLGNVSGLFGERMLRTMAFGTLGNDASLEFSIFFTVFCLYRSMTLSFPGDAGQYYP